MGVNSNAIEKSIDIAKKCAEELNLEVVDASYVMDAGNKILRIIAQNNLTETLSLDEATELNNLISDKLDENDYIDEEYYLEVSSPGLERELKSDTDIIKAIDKYIFASTYEKINNKKEFYGFLKSYIDNVVKIEIDVKNKKEIIEIPRSKISKIRLAVKF